MNDFLPDELPPVHYFLKELNNWRTLTLFRVLFIGLILISALIYFLYRRKLPKTGDELNKSEKT